MSGEGTPTQDDDGCWICKQCTCPEGWSSSSTCPTKAGYTCVTEKTANTCGRADKCFKYSYGKSCLNKLAQDDLDNNNYANLAIKRISTNPTGTCLDGYEYRYTGVADDWNKSCYMCTPIPVKTKTCEDYGYHTITKSNYNEWMQKCGRLISVKPKGSLECWMCEPKPTPKPDGSGDTCTGTLTATVSCNFFNQGYMRCTSYIPSCQSRIVSVKVFSSSGSEVFEGGIGNSSYNSPTQAVNVSTCKFYGASHGVVGTASISSDGNGNFNCSYSFTK